MEQELTAGLGKRQMAKLVQNDEVEAGQVIGQAPLASAARFTIEVTPLISTTSWLQSNW